MTSHGGRGRCRLAAEQGPRSRLSSTAAWVTPALVDNRCSGGVRRNVGGVDSPSPQDSPDTEMKAAALAGGGSQERQANSGPVLLSRPAPIASFEMSVDLNRSRSGGRFSDVA